MRAYSAAADGWDLADDGPSPAARLRAWGWRLLDGCVVVWLSLASGAVLPLLFSDPGSTELGEGAKAVLRLFLLPSLLLAPVVALTRPRSMLALAVRHWPLGLLLLWVWCSVAWTLDPGATIRRATALTAFTVIACWLAIAYEPRALLRRLAWALLAQVALSLALAAVLPAYALMPDDRLLRGIFLHKNVLGQVLTFAAILLLLGWQFRFLPRIATFLGLGLVLVAAALAGSITACLLIAAMMVLQLLLHLATLGRVRAAASLLLAAAIGSLLVMAALLLLEPLLGLIGRDLTFTGRTDLWAYVVRMIELRPLLGYGYGAFFELPAISAYVLDTLHWAAPNAHNGYLETALGLGLPGLALVLLFLLGGLATALRTLACAGRAGPDRLPGAFAVLYLAAFLLRNAAESDLLSQSQLSWVLAVLAVILASRRTFTPPARRRQPGTNPANQSFTNLH